MNESNIKQIRKLPIAIFWYILIMIILSLISALNNPGNITIFKARESDNFHEKTYKRVQLQDSYFVTGMEGEVFWKTKSFTETYIIENIVKDSPYSFLDILYVILFDTIIFWMVYDIQADNIFSEKILKGLRLINFFLLLLIGRNIFHHLLANYFLKEITNGKFESILLSNTSMIPYFICVSIFQVIPYFIKKGQKNEQEQNLTV